ncbi:heterodisulfide reductase subunit A [Chlorobaculum limnaeum]|uniref:Heterodisulfide reductase subunit A n=1 Tax=Chlorobaculum limnaeum TaxID=274537 RepID=A0A1D8CY73_CHLLM|nr:CoB--CoM heterodisulfide reductase iron-sulfur subunit A family protein [Chlorobaculum limnaeum]AOS83882.1 heterodisulfide reductase subunit A [Chlorobaculum limnaeum]
MSVETILIVGGGISGITTAVEAAEVGYNTVLVEKNPYLGGRVSQLNKYFPKLCPPYCGLEMNFRRIKPNPKITVYTMTEVESVSGQEGNYSVRLKVSPRYVNEKCTVCNACAEACPAERPNEFNFGMDKTKAAYLPHVLSYPMRYVIDRNACKDKSCDKCVKACKYNAIDLDMKPQTIEMKVGSIVYATGWNPYDATRMENLGYGRVKNVITNMMMERLAAPNGPTGGKLLRPSDKKEVKKVVFVQCAGSRDENHLNYCSSICCMASLKQATYIRERVPDAKVVVAYIDLRAPGKYEEFLNKVQSDANVKLVKGKVAKIEEDPSTGGVILEFEDVEGGGKVHERADMAVLATGMEPSVKTHSMLSIEENGFINGGSAPGIYSTGVAKRPSDVTTSIQDATGMALKSIQSLVRS